MCDSRNDDFPFGKIQWISEVGSVHKIDKLCVKDSVYRLISYLHHDTSDEPTLLLCDMKVRVVPETSHQEREQVLQYHCGEKYISTHFNASISWYYISKPSKRLQVLHHCYMMLLDF